MKNTIFLSFLILTISSVNAQENTNAISKKHEVRLGVVKLLVGPIFEGVYEYVQDSNRGFGAAVLISFNTDYLEDYSLTPFYRMYFQTREDYGAKGFFAEGFTSFFGGQNDNNYTSIGGINLVEEGNNFFDISIGLALGKKWINTTGFVFEFKVGAGRNLLGEADIEGLFKGDLYIGYRF